jgi:hypothetical protein
MRRLYVDEVVGEAVRAVAVVATAKGLRVSSELQPDVAIDGDDGLLHRMTNLSSIRYASISRSRRSSQAVRVRSNIRRTETSITGGSLHQQRKSGLHTQVGRDVGHFGVNGLIAATPRGIISAVRV